MSAQKNKPAKPSEVDPISGPQRLQRVMAAAGIGSRRECEIIIQEGRVEVDGQIIATLGVKVDPQSQKIFVDGQRLVAERLQYFMLNKPPGVISTNNDPSGRARVIDLIKTEQRVYNVGRLDQSSEGLILVTNDGELANRLTHPRYGIEKKYHVQVAGVPTAEQLRALEEGVYFAEGKAKATSAKFLRKIKTSSWIEIILAEGRNREIRRMLASVGHKVRTLKRVSIGPLKMGDLPVGAHRALTLQELKLIKRAADGLAKTRPKTNKKKSASKKFAEIGESPAITSGTPRDTAKKSSKLLGSPASKRTPAKGGLAKFTSKKGTGTRTSGRSTVSAIADEKLSHRRTPFDKPPEITSDDTEPMVDKSATRKRPGSRSEFSKTASGQPPGNEPAYSKSPGTKSGFSKSTRSKSASKKSTSSKSTSGKARFVGKSTDNKKTKSRSSANPRSASSNRPANRRQK